MANSEALYCTKKGTIAIPTDPELFIQIWDVCYVSNASANLISMGILKRCGWSYLDEDDHMLLTKAATTIRAKLIKQNIYCLVIYRSKDVIIAVQGQQGRPTHLISATLMQHLWHQRFEHVSHARIKLASIIVNGLLLNQVNELYEATNESASDFKHLSLNNSEHLSLNNSEHLTPDVESHSVKGKSNCTIELLAVMQADEASLSVCTLCIQSKQTRIIQYTLMRATN